MKILDKLALFSPTLMILTVLLLPVVIIYAIGFIIAALLEWSFGLDLFLEITLGVSMFIILVIAFSNELRDLFKP